MESIASEDHREGWRHKSIILDMLSDDSRYQDIVLSVDKLREHMVVVVECIFNKVDEEPV